MKVVSIVGARPQFIKAAVVFRAIREHKDKGEDIKDILIHTGQHYDDNMSRIFFDELDIHPPDYNLGIGSYSHGKQTGKMLEGIEEVLIKESPDWTMVYGDTNSTLAGALAAAKLHIPVAHVEAGLRSFNRDMPEEINRILTDHLSDLLFCPTTTAVDNLSREGITKGVYNVGDIMYDSVKYNLKRAESKSNILYELDLCPKTYYLTTVHRVENTDNTDRLRSILQALAGFDVPVVFPVHPRTNKIIMNLTFGLSKIKFIPPVSYLDALVLEKNAQLILTDSGGVQKEAYFLKVPCVTLREETEWIETVKSGQNVLVGADEEKIRKAVIEFSKRGNNSPYPPFYGEGKTAQNIIDLLIHSEGG